jgi:type VI secretion system secreted protein Hcp
MTLQLYATVTGAVQGPFKGEATSPKLLHKIPGIAFSYGVLNPHDVATGAPSGRRQHQPITFTKQWGASSPQFYQAAYTNEVLTTVLFEFFLPLSDGTESLDHTIKLTNATIFSTQQALHLGQLNGPPVDSRELHEISFHFQKIEITSLTGHTQATDNWQITT